MVKPLFDPTFYDFEQQASDVYDETYKKLGGPWDPGIPDYDTTEELQKQLPWVVVIGIIALVALAALVGWYFLTPIDTGP